MGATFILQSLKLPPPEAAQSPQWNSLPEVITIKRQELGSDQGLDGVWSQAVEFQAQVTCNCCMNFSRTGDLSESLFHHWKNGEFPFRGLSQGLKGPISAKHLEQLPGHSKHSINAVRCHCYHFLSADRVPG